MGVVDSMLRRLGLQRRTSDAKRRSSWSGRNYRFLGRDLTNLADSILREYSSAKSDRLTSGWTTVPTPPSQTIRRELRTLRARSREQVMNNAQARRFMALLVTNVVGPRGVQLQAAAQDPDGGPDRLANAAIESGWKDWGRPQNCDFEGRLSWLEMQKLILRTAAEDGEALIRLYRGRSRGPYGFQLQLVDPELLDNALDQELIGGRFIRHGIEFDEAGRVTAYYLIDTSGAARRSSFYTSYTFGPNAHVRIPASQMLHLFLVEKAGQHRGLPWMSTVLLPMSMLEAYGDAAIVAARAGASKMGHYKQEQTGQYVGDDVEDAATPDASAQLEEFEPGIIRKLDPGVSFEGWDPSYPHEQFPAFWKAIQRSIASGLGISYNDLANDLEGVNFSSLRHGRLQDQDVWMALQEWLIGHLCQPVYRAWLSSALLAGALQVTGGPGMVVGTLKPEREEKFTRVRWRPRRWKWVDPQKETEANNSQVEALTRSRSSVIREQGEDPEEVWEEIARERRVLEQIVGVLEAANSTTVGGEGE